MMKEQKEAVERLNNYKEHILKCGNKKSKHFKSVVIVLNMLKEKDAEIEKLKQALARNIAKNFTSIMKESAKSKEDLEMLNAGWQIELEKKDKIIDLMAEFIFQNIDIEEDICNSAYVECKQETSQDITCIKCIKQYFERKVKE